MKVTKINLRLSSLNKWILVGSWFFLSVFLGLSSPVVHAKEASVIFENNCSGCHSIGQGILVGPDLINVTKRRDRSWLTEFTLNPQALFEKGDPAAHELKEAYGDVMPGFSELTREKLDALWTYIESLSQAKGVPEKETDAKETLFTEEDIQRGRNLFTGTKTLKKNGPACLACHSSSSLDGLGGGHLGPDLSQMIEHLGGQKGLRSWLGTIPSLTMKPIYSQHPLEEDEILSLTAFFEAERSFMNACPHFYTRILGLGVAGTVILLLLLGTIWRRRLRAIRAPMVQGKIEER